ncbi:MAG: hypothetical protein AMJ55_02975 [Gammaproteobacteria bacterium SG8_15]|nr:MAG: hypothetical protein AMJ55_02975 [Gammaproteobacteria bacterium SG8_15]
MPDIRMTDEFREVRGRRLYNLVMRDLRDRQGRIERIAQVRALYLDEAPSQVGPWAGASDVHIPVIADKVDGAVPKIISAFWGTDPLAHVQYPAGQGRHEEAKEEEQFINWSFRSDIPDFYGTFEDWTRNTLIDGVSVLKTTYERTWRKTIERRPIKLMYGEGDVSSYGDVVVAARPKDPEEILAEIFGFPQGNVDQLVDTLANASFVDGPTDQLPGQRWEVEFVEDRRMLDGTVVFQDSEFVDEVDVYIYRYIMEKDGPCVTVVDFEDFIVPYRTREIQAAARVTHQYWITVEEARRRMDSGEWQVDEEDRRFMETRRPSREQEAPENMRLSRQKDMALGEEGQGTREEDIEAPENHATYDENKILVFEIYLKDDVDGDGEPTEVIYDLPYDLRKLVRARYLDDEFPHRERPFVASHYKRVSGRFYGRSMAEELAQINIEVNTIVNHINNAQELINNPFFFYVPAAMTASPEWLKGIRPGEGVPVQDISGVLFPRFQQEPLANLSTVDTMLMFADRLTLSPLNSGSTQMRNAPRTARGTMTLVAEGNIKIDNMITRLQERSWGPLCNQVAQMYGYFGGEEKWYRITGQAEPQRLSMSRIRDKLDYIFKGNTVNTNPEIMRNIAQVRYNTLLTHPAYMQDPQASLSVLRDFLNHWGEGADVEALMPKPPGQSLYTHPPMEQESENESLARGIFVDVLPVDDDATHLRVMEQFSRTSRFETLPQEAVAVFAAHMRAHAAQLQAKMTSGTMGQAPGQGNNVPLGMTQEGGGGEDLGALEGGVQ